MDLVNPDCTARQLREALLTSPEPVRRWLLETPAPPPANRADTIRHWSEREEARTKTDLLLLHLQEEDRGIVLEFMRDLNGSAGRG